jgi:hypothetical protein
MENVETHFDSRHARLGTCQLPNKHSISVSLPAKKKLTGMNLPNGCSKGIPAIQRIPESTTKQDLKLALQARSDICKLSVVHDKAEHITTVISELRDLLNTDLTGSTAGFQLVKSSLDSIEGCLRNLENDSIVEQNRIVDGIFGTVQSSSSVPQDDTRGVVVRIPRSWRKGEPLRFKVDQVAYEAPVPSACNPGDCMKFDQFTCILYRLD